jgi:NLPC_P60 stabilising domain, N term/SH3 domain (SH3b1 type)/SH3 domain of SH3b2 type/NlpC/P60 family
MQEYMALMRLHNIPILLALILITSACAETPGTIRDILDLKQDNLFYIDKNESDSVFLTADDQKKMDANYDYMFFSPWHRIEAFYSKETVESAFKKYRDIPGYAENRRKHHVSWIRDLAANAHLENYPNACFKAITIDNSDLRVLPTHKPRFHESNTDRGFPFDSLQESSVAPNTPVFISHVTKDKAWVLAETPYAVGWISPRHIAKVDGNFVKKWERGQYAVIIKDKTPIYDEEGRFLFKAPLGSMYPKLEEDAKNIKMLVAVTDQDGNAFMKDAIVSKEAAASKPLVLTRSNIAKLANELINESYGWGGLYQNRDCSAMIKDLFAPFGLWLPRHSADQAREGGTFIDLQKLSAKEKELTILKQGIPYLTLVWRKGHIMLYIGSYEGKILVFHNFWGVRTKDFLGRETRKIVGHAAITTLHPGIEFNDSDKTESDYLKGILGMTLLVSPKNPEISKQ